MDDVMFAYKPRLLNVAAQLKRSAHAALDLAIKCVLDTSRRFRARRTQPVHTAVVSCSSDAASYHHYGGHSLVSE